MQVKRLAWLGTRTERFEETTAFFRDVLGLSVVHTEQGMSMLKLSGPDEDVVEVFGPENPAFPFYTAGPVVGLLVDDLAEARAELEAAAIELIDDTRWPEATHWPEDPVGYGWFHIRGPDGNVYAVLQGSEPLPG